MKTTITTTTTSINPSSIPPAKPKIHSPERFQNTLSIKFPRNAQFISPKSGFSVKCSTNGRPESENNGSLKDVLSGMVDERVEQLLNKEENRGLLDGLEQASRRVEMAKRELAEIEKQEMEAKAMREYINQLESRASEIAECQKEILEARVMVEKAERSLTQGNTLDALTETETEAKNKNEERVESIKAASIAAIIGTLAELPISLARVDGNTQLILPLAITFVSCALFGVTFRYAVRRDLDNIQLKSGTSAAFAFVKGLGTVGGGPPLELDAGSILTHANDAAVYVSESLLIFLFAGVALDFCIKLRVLSPFPIDRSVPRI